MSLVAFPNRSVHDAVRVVLRNSYGDGDGCQAETAIAVAALKTARALDDASPVIRTAVTIHMGYHFHMFEPRPSPSFTSTSGKWIPRLDSSPLQIKEYVTHYFGEGDVLAQDVLDQTEAFDRYSGNFAPSIKVDARLSGAANISREAIYGPLCYPLWMAITTLVCRVGMPNPNLKYLHLRFSANDALLGRVEHIVASNPRLLDVVIEIDYPQAAHHVQDRPVLRLAKIADRYTQYAPLDRFVVRAPGVDVDAEDATSFASRIRRCSTLVFAVRSVRYVTAVRQWSMHLLRDLTCAQQVEISVANDQPPRPQAPRSFVKMHLPSLVHLTLDFSGIGAGFLHNVDAKGLKFIRIRTDRHLGRQGRCSPGHFPSLLAATIHCPGLVHERFRTLGLRACQFVHCLDPKTTKEDALDGEVSCVGITEHQRGSSDDVVESHGFHDQDSDTSGDSVSDL